LLRNTTTESR